MVEILKDTTRGVALGTILTATALSVESGHGTGLLHSFLMKKVMANVGIRAGTIGELIIVGLARGDASVGEIKAAMEAVQLERDIVTQASNRVVLYETLRILNLDPSQQPMHYEVSLGGGKGIPFEDGDGWQWFVYNVGSATLTTGALISMDATYYGVWLN